MGRTREEEGSRLLQIPDEHGQASVAPAHIGNNKQAGRRGHPAALIHIHTSSFPRPLG